MGIYKPIRILLMTGFCGFAGAFAVPRGSAVPNTFTESADLGNRTAKTSEDVDKYVAELDKTEHALFLVSQAPEFWRAGHSVRKVSRVGRHSGSHRWGSQRSRTSVRTQHREALSGCIRRAA